MRNPLSHVLPLCVASTFVVLIELSATAQTQDAPPRHVVRVPAVTPETPAEAASRHELGAKRRSGVEIICHRGAQEFAHENTLEAYRTTLELGGDGNEIDIRATRDGVLVCFHDDMLDRLLEACTSNGCSTALELIRHRLRVVRGRAILQCLSHADKPWARAAIEQGAPYALAYILPQ